MRIGSLCSGYEGLGLAVQSVLGGELAWVADNDPGAAKILAHHYPDVPNLGDITTIDWAAVASVDILLGGYPCQPFSDAGLRKGTADERHIWPYIAAAIRILRPRLIVLENVRGHLGRGLDAVLGDLAALGFDAEWVTMPAAGVGACHRRQRVFILGWPPADAGGERRDRWPGGCGTGGRAAVREQARDHGVHTVAHLLKTPTAQLAINGGSQPPDKRRAGGHGPTLADQVEHDLLLPTPTANISGRTGEQHTGDAGVDRPHDTESARGRSAAPDWATDKFWRHPGAFGPYETAVRQHERVFGRRAPAPVEPGRGGKPRLAPAFAEWMMGLPAGWVTDVPGLSRNDQLHAIGNGVMPQQGAAAIRLLLERAPEACFRCCPAKRRWPHDPHRLRPCRSRRPHPPHPAVR